ncbi:MAG: hypothetical protein PF574_05155 [Candidatus Delongbacteria bacterium]|jgi:hypothetical protein|nr:hypothetical protein [Candidatus Delongbacteria bacterium]
MKKIFISTLIVLIFLSCTKTQEDKTDTTNKVITKKPTEKVEKNVAQTYVDAQKKNIDNAKASVEKNNKAQEDQKNEIDNLLGE